MYQKGCDYTYRFAVCVGPPWKGQPEQVIKHEPLKRDQALQRFCRSRPVATNRLGINAGSADQLHVRIHKK